MENDSPVLLQDLESSTKLLVIFKVYFSLIEEEVCFRQ